MSYTACYSVHNALFLVVFRTEDETELNLGTSFSAETNRRDEDADM